MSYSRWSHICWYTFWCGQPSDQKETRASALFEVCGVCHFNAAELRKNIDLCVELACAKAGFEVKPDEAKELREYMADFLEDVDRKYPKHEHA